MDVTYARVAADCDRQPILGGEGDHAITGRDAFAHARVAGAAFDAAEPAIIEADRLAELVAVGRRPACRRAVAEQFVEAGHLQRQIGERGACRQLLRRRLRGVELERGRAVVILTILPAELDRDALADIPFEIEARGLVARVAVGLGVRPGAVDGAVGKAGPVFEVGGIGNVDPEIDGRVGVVLAEIDREIVGVVGVDIEPAACRLAEIGILITDQAAHLELVGKAMLEIERELLEGRAEFGDPALRPDVDAIVQAVEDRAVGIDIDILDRRHRLAVVAGRARERQARNIAVRAVCLVARIETVERHVGVVVGLPLQGERGAETVGILFGVEIARQAWEEGAAAGLA